MWDGFVGVLTDGSVGVAVGAVVGVLASPLVGVVVGAPVAWVEGMVVLLLSAGAFPQAVIDNASSKAKTIHRILFINSVHSIFLFVQIECTKYLAFCIILTLIGTVCKHLSYGAPIITAKVKGIRIAPLTDQLVALFV